jgi:hypothetical protein
MHPFFRIRIDPHFVDRSDWVKYYTLTKYQTEILQKVNPELLDLVPDDKFMKFVETQVSSYLDGKQPAQEISSAIMNCADMCVSGDAIELRAGDYIALQTHFQNQAR